MTFTTPTRPRAGRFLLRLAGRLASPAACLAMWGPCFALAALGLGAGGRGPAYEIGSIPGKT